MDTLTDKEISLIEVGRVLSEYAKRYEELIKRKIQDEDMIATGKLLASISTEVIVDGVIYKVVLNSLEYIKYLESGTKPHYPPQEPIIKWIRAKKLPTKDYCGGDLPTEKQLAFLIQRKIGLFGTEARPIMANTANELNEQYIPRIMEALQIDIQRSLPNIILTIK